MLTIYTCIADRAGTRSQPRAGGAAAGQGARRVDRDGRFRAGYSSLSNLRAFRFDKLKIDRSFIKSVNSNAQAAAIVRAVVGLGRGLGLPVLAEGVETEAELQFLIDEDCNEVQGYLLGRPATISSFNGLTGDAGAHEPAARPRASSIG